VYCWCGVAGFFLARFGCFANFFCWLFSLFETAEACSLKALADSPGGLRRPAPFVRVRLLPPNANSLQTTELEEEPTEEIGESAETCEEETCDTAPTVSTRQVRSFRVRLFSLFGRRL
jgi:hypothetical protein